MFQQVTPRLLWLVSLCVVLIIGIIGCGGDGDNEADTDWVGTWYLESIDGTSIQQQLTVFKQLAAAFGQVLEISYADDWTFNDNGTWHRNTTYEVDEGNGQETTSIEGMGTYTLAGSSYSLTVTEVTGDVETDAIELELDFEEIVSGTWSRNGNTLILTGDDGTTLSFKKK